MFTRIRILHAVSFLILASVFLQMPDLAAVQPAMPVQWDDDGGYSGDYSNIPRLKWFGPGSPSTYREYMSRRSEAPFLAAHLWTASPPRSIARAVKAMVIVNTGLYPGIQTSLATYTADLVNDGYTVDLYQASGGTPTDLRNFIITNSIDVKGCVLVGDQPAAWFEYDNEQFPCDLFFMDLDGDWLDTDFNGIFDSHSSGSGDEGPEIFVGRIDASMMGGDEAANTNDYFLKNHAYRTGGLYLPGHALTYTEDDWAMFMDIRTDIKYAYSSYDDVPAPATDRDDYVNNRIQDIGYEFIQLACHSWDQGHAFTRGGYAYYYDITAAVPEAVFYNLFCCSSLDWTVSDFLGGSFIFNDSDRSLAVIGSTKSGSMLEFYAFYQPLGRYETFGESFRQWFNYLAPYNGYEISWHFGMTVAGDPFLALQMSALRLSLPDGSPEGYRPPGPAVPVTLEIRNGSENYVPGSGLIHYRLDPGSGFMTASLSSLGSDLYEGVMPGARPGDEPEFYFSAQGDGGTTITSPFDAPNSTYSYDICLVETVMSDDFEADAGWTVDSQNLQTGEWVRDDPIGTSAQPEDDHSIDGTDCFFTGQGSQGGSSGEADVDGGPTTLTSPEIDLSDGDATINFYLWFHHTDYGTQQPLEVDLSDDGGTTWIKAADITNDPSWQLYSYNVSDHVTPSARVKVRIRVNDNPNDDIVEAAVDDFSVDRYDFDPGIWLDSYTLPASTGASVTIYLDAGPAHAGRQYIVAGGLSGSMPGTVLPSGKILPVNRDWLTDYIYRNMGPPLFPGFIGLLDSQGRASAGLVIPGGLATPHAGETLTFAFTLTNGNDFVSNPVFLLIEP